MRQRRLMVLGAAFILLPFADCLLRAAASSEIADGTDLLPSVPAQEQPEVLTRGPVHEAFAEPITLQTDEGLVSFKQPPPSINEILSGEKPEGDNFVWVPGYWAWDVDRNDYIWVSGCWRTAPPKMSWMPGYWTRINAGWKWVSGFWMQTGNNEIEYLRAPPPAVDIEPPDPSPSRDGIWVPGCWYWVNDRYVSRPGYWLQGQSGWVWIPSHYIWTPRGYVFSNGHWDYTVEQRGVLFAPVYFPSSVAYTRTDYRYSLGVVVDLGLLRVNLFCYPRYSHYYFGDYYDDTNIRIGIFPCFESEQRRIWYDPIYQYDRWHSRDPRWEEHERNSYELRRNDRDLRPAMTYREQESRLSKMSEKQRDNYQISLPVSATSSARSASRKFEQNDNDSRQKISKQANDVQNYREERRQWESTSTNSKGIQPSVERVKDDGSINSKSSEVHVDTAGQSDRGKDMSYRITRKSADRNEPSWQAESVKNTTQNGGQYAESARDDGIRSAQTPDAIESTGKSERVADSTPRSVHSSTDHHDISGRSELVRVPDSPVSDRVLSYANGDRFPSAPTEERRGQDYGRDSRSDDGQHGRSKDSR